MSSVREEDRIRRHFKSLKAAYGRDEWDGGRNSLTTVFMHLARRWKRPIYEIKNILGVHGRTDWKRGETWYTGQRRTG